MKTFKLATTFLALCTLALVGCAGEPGYGADTQEIRERVFCGGFAGIDIQVRGYSELSPVACNETLEGRAINRRVEIWIE